jgi:hypothetical protein
MKCSMSDERENWLDWQCIWPITTCLAKGAIFPEKMMTYDDHMKHPKQ